MAGFDLDPITLELTYGLERVAMFIQGKNSVFDLEWAPGITWGDVNREVEVQFSRYNFEVADVEMHRNLFEMYEKECLRLIEADLVLPAYDYVLKASHTFNMLDARGAIGVAERTAYIGRVRRLARACAEVYLALRERLGHPLLVRAGEEAAAT